MVQGLAWNKRMGALPPEMTVSTGTLTRIVTSTMEQNKASQKFFWQIFLILSIFISSVSFPGYTYTVTFLIWVLGANSKVIVKNVLGICVKIIITDAHNLQVSFSRFLLVYIYTLLLCIYRYVS